MAKKNFKRPDDAAMRRVLERYAGKSAEVVLRLAWTAGLTAVEMHELKWTDVSFADGQLRLPDRSVPMDGDLRACLERRYETDGRRQEFVVVSDQRRAHMHRVHISKAASEALDTEELLREITLKDLREDFVIRMLERHDWPYVSRITGTSISTMYANYAPYMKQEPTGKAETQVDEFAIWQILQTEGASPEGLALWMSRELGLSLKEIAALTWEQVDMTERVLRLPGRTVPMGARLERLLQDVESKRSPGDDPHVLLTPRAKGAFDARRLGLVVRQALIRGGLDALTAEALIVSSQQQKTDGPILQLINQNGSVLRNDVTEALGITRQQAWQSLNRLTEQGKIVRIGLRYFKPGAVIPPERQYELIAAHLRKRGTASRQELAALLELELRQCGWILSRMVEDGLLERQGRRYCLPETVETQAPAGR